MRDQSWPGAAALNRQVGGRRLEHLLALAAGVTRADVADDLQPGRDFLQDLADVLAEPGQLAPVAGAAAAHDGRLVHHGFARQMIRKRLARRPSARLGGFAPARRRREGRLAASLAFLEILQLQLELHDGSVQPFGGAAVLLAPQRRQLHPQMLDLHRRRAELGLGRSQLMAEVCDLLIRGERGQIHPAILANRPVSYKSIR